MTSKEIAKRMLPYNLVGALFLLVGVIKSHGIFALLPLSFTLTWTTVLIWVAKRKRSSEYKSSEG